MFFKPPPERNFNKSLGNRRHGCATGTDRRRIPCEETRCLQQEADASENNEHHVAEALSRMGEKERDQFFINLAV